ncbi:PREDICTED: insulin-like growth factor-binding protein-related protein 1, partial [Priapulus caudatus]|uniref:Insulin-like growth factor-binding protein-related protein 1 n=1 Tax=Priapulus caudatus TaxID=37621 RepID=A0ABM1E5L3_PRICU
MLPTGKEKEIATMMRYVVLICALAACVAWAAEHENCGECDREKCPRLTEANCTTGLVHDKCQCCFACGREEGQLCNNRDEKCGEDLECTFREDPRLDDQPQATCVCKYSELLCAEDGRTFRNLCQLMAESFRSNTTIKLRSRGPCRAAPKVISSTGDMVVDAGDELMLACESDGYPIPVVGWTYTGAAGSFINLPVDDHMAIQARGGPE